MTSRRLPWFACVVFGVTLGHAGRPAHAQSLVEAARLAREIRDDLGRPAKVYTNEDLPDARRVTEPTRAWVSLYASLLEAAHERERLLLERLRERPATPRASAQAPVKTVRSNQASPSLPMPRRTTPGIPLSLVYGGAVVVVAPHRPRPRDETPGELVSRPHRRGSRARGRRPRLETPPRRHARARGDDPSPAPPAVPAAMNAYDASSRPLDYIGRGLPVSRAYRNGARHGPRAP